MASLACTCLALAVLSSLSLVLAGAPAADGYESFGSVTSRYKLYPFKANWHEAHSACQLDGGGAHLVVINSEPERQIVLYFFSKIRDGSKQLYVGINDLGAEGTWVTVTGGLVASSGFASWDKNQPDDNVNEDCGTITRNGVYNDVECNSKKPFLCEKPGV